MTSDYRVIYSPRDNTWVLLRSIGGGEWYACGMVDAEVIRFLGRFTDSDSSEGEIEKDAKIALGYMAAKFNILANFGR